MVTDILIHAADACVARSIAPVQAADSLQEQRVMPSAKRTGIRLNPYQGDHCAYNLLTSTLISIAVFEKGGVAFDY